MSPTRPQTSTLGCCPECQATLATADVLISYERAGQSEVWADCPECGAVVHPV
jgi:hypothetical protein